MTIPFPTRGDEAADDDTPAARMPRWSASTRSGANTDIDTRRRGSAWAICGPKRRPHRGPRAHIVTGSAPMSQSDFALFMGQLMPAGPTRSWRSPRPPGSSAPRWWPNSTPRRPGDRTGRGHRQHHAGDPRPRHRAGAPSFHRDEPGVLQPPARPLPAPQRPPDERGRRGRSAGRERAGRDLGPAAPVDAAGTAAQPS
jgi:hypothetical protein